MVPEKLRYQCSLASGIPYGGITTRLATLLPKFMSKGGFIYTFRSKFCWSVYMLALHPMCIIKFSVKKGPNKLEASVNIFVLLIHWCLFM